MSAGAKLSLGPLLFNWTAERVAAFYAGITEDRSVDTVHLGEVVCPKRAPFLDEALAEAAGSLAAAGIEVVWSTLGLIADARDVESTRSLVDSTDGLVEVNDVTALPMLEGRAHAVGPLVNVYNEGTLRWLAARGAARACLPPELPREAIAALAAADTGVELEIQVFGRMPLALSARCYHARAHGLHKDGCRYVCDKDPNGMPVTTLDRQAFLAVNGIQTLSHALLDLSAEARDLMAIGIRRFRLSPHDADMSAVARVWRGLLDGKSDIAQAQRMIEAAAHFAPRANGYYHGRPGAELVA
jgi:collagenase-like PrtC family protease